MRHAQRGRKLGRTTSHRLAMFKNQLTSLVVHERIVTTLPKAKELRPIAEKLVTRGKAGSVADRREAGRLLQNRDQIKKLFDDIGPRFADRAGGYLRIVKLGPRQGDGAETAALQFVDYDPDRGAVEETDDKKAKGKGKAKDEEKGKTKAQAKGKQAAKGKAADDEPKGKAKAKKAKAKDDDDEDDDG
jgi:large subunit ribosomal protein L17